MDGYYPRSSYNVQQLPSQASSLGHNYAYGATSYPGIQPCLLNRPVSMQHHHCDLDYTNQISCAVCNPKQACSHGSAAMYQSMYQQPLRQGINMASSCPCCVGQHLSTMPEYPQFPQQHMVNPCSCPACLQLLASRRAFHETGPHVTQNYSNGCGCQSCAAKFRNSYKMNASTVSPSSFHHPGMESGYASPYLGCPEEQQLIRRSMHMDNIMFQHNQPSKSMNMTVLSITTRNSKPTDISNRLCVRCRHIPSPDGGVVETPKCSFAHKPFTNVSIFCTLFENCPL